ncbi:MAG: glycosyltransferase family 39 protein [Lachnospiraceae bacterium]|nr:glycosyltransferase family 39 protein [Lachnospiraceae bacterium]
MMKEQNSNRAHVLIIIYTIVLILYPLVRANEGLYVADTTYSLSNFVFFDSMSGTWTIATFLANVCGYFLMHLPFGETMLGINIYTSLVVSITAIISFFILKKEINTHIVFAGEMLALSLCWCPTVILYNYLTYLLFTAGALLLYRAVLDDDKRKYVLSGFLLGINVLTRLPNVTEALLIVVLWYAGVIDHKSVKKMIQDTLMCIAGYLSGFLLIFAVICIRYSPAAYVGMIRNLFLMTDKAVDYKPASMVTAMFEDYLYAGRWIVFWIAGAVLCALVYLVVHRFTCAKKDNEVKQVRYANVICVILSLMIFGLVVRVCYGRGMFSFRYYEYGCMYFWAVILLLATTVISLIYMIRSTPVVTDTSEYRQKRILSLLVLIMIYVTCIGSNNGLYPIVNNMFVTAPYILWVLYDLAVSVYQRNRMAKREVQDKKTPGMIMSALVYVTAITLVLLVSGTFVQGIGFHFCNAFNDGIYGEKRDSFVDGYTRTAGIHTTAENAKSLKELMDYMYANKKPEDSVILYGDIPGLGYLLEMPSAISTFWPDLDSYNYAEWTDDINGIYGYFDGADKAEGDLPVIIVTLPVAAVEGGDPEAISYFGADSDKYLNDRKLSDLADIIHSFGYEQVYVNDRYAVYEK